jgi:hypothetical protein
MSVSGLECRGVVFGAPSLGTSSDSGPFRAPAQSRQDFDADVSTGFFAGFIRAVV